MRRMFVSTVLTLAVAARAWTETAPTADLLTLDEAVSLALRNNRNLANAAMEVERAEQRVGAARARRLPNLELQGMAGTTLNPIRISFPAGAFGSFPATGPIPAQDTVVEAPRSVTGMVNASLSQPLTRLHRIGLNTRLSKLSRDIEREKLREDRAAVVADVRRLYYQILQTGSALRAKEEQVQPCEARRSRILAAHPRRSIHRQIGLLRDGLVKVASKSTRAGLAVRRV